MRRLFVRTCIATAVTFAVLQIAGCGGGGGGGSNTSSSGTSTTPVAAMSLVGTVATGTALVGAKVTLTDVNGKQLSATTDTNGTYSIPLAGLSVPFVLVAVDATGQAAPLVSVLAAWPAGNAQAVANVTTLTTAIAALLTSSGNPLDLSTPATLASLSSAAVQAAVTKLNTALASVLIQNGLSAGSFDPIGTPFVANHSGADGVIDTLTLVRSATGGDSLVSNGAPGAPWPLNNQAPAPAPFTPPATSPGYLGALPALLTACFASSTPNTACSPVIDSGYLENGSADIVAAHGFADATFSGAVFGFPQTLEFFTQNSQQLALIVLPYTLSDGTFGSFVTIAQKLATPVTLANGTQLAWDLIGNQSKFRVSIRSQISRRQFLDTKANDVSRFESGLEVDIPVTSNPANLYSASVSGPGLSSPIWLLPRNALGNSNLGLSDTQLTAAPVSPITTTSNTSLYRWSWQPMTSGATFTAPATSGFYASQAVDPGTVPLFATYTVTFFDATGTQIGQSSIINASGPISASAGPMIPWPALSTDVQGTFLSPAGSLAGAQSSVAVNWSGFVNGLNIGLPVTSVQIQTTPGQGTTVTTGIDGFASGAPVSTSTGQFQATVVAGLTSNGTQSCTGCQFLPLTTGASRLIQLQSLLGGTAFYTISKYND